MWSITQLRSILGSPPPCAVAAEFGCAPGFPSVFLDAGPDLHAETASNARPAAARTPRLRNALQSVENVISILLISILRHKRRSLFADVRKLTHFLSRHDCHYGFTLLEFQKNRKSSRMWYRV